MPVPLVFCQAADECTTMGRDTASRFLNVYNIHHTGHMHVVFLVHIGMRVRLTQKINATFVFVQEQKATVVSIVMHISDDARYPWASPGSIFRPRFLFARFWLQVDDYFVLAHVLKIVSIPIESDV